MLIGPTFHALVTIGSHYGRRKTNENVLTKLIEIFSYNLPKMFSFAEM
jgi:hypothetical protein